MAIALQDNQCLKACEATNRNDLRVRLPLWQVIREVGRRASRRAHVLDGGKHVPTEEERQTPVEGATNLFFRF